MTYCVALFLRDGLVFLSDTRTNAGVDHISTFPKSFIIENPGERAMVLMTAGNLGTTQAVVNRVIEGHAGEGEKPATLSTVPSMVGAAELVGSAVRHVLRTGGDGGHSQDSRFDATFILGGQIRERRMRLFEIYSAGNFIEASVDTPFLQIGEHKYGKPILDRALSHDTSVIDGVKIALVSMDSTLRSNISVGLPADLTTFAKDECRISLHRRINDDDPYFSVLREHWSSALRAALAAAPAPHWED